MEMPDPDWINDPVEALRRWRDARPEVIDPVLPPDIGIEVLAPEGGCPGGLAFVPLAGSGASGGDIYGQLKGAETGHEAVPVVYFHGGGFIVGSPWTHRVVTAWIAQETGARVVSIRYRLAPEHSFPAQALDAVAALRRQLAQAGRLRIMGDSAGGLVALWAFAGLSDAERARIDGVTLFYPGAGPGMPRAAENAAHDAMGLGPKSLEAYHRQLDPGGLIAGDTHSDPLAPGFPWPARLTILAAGDDPMLRDAEALAQAGGARLLVAAGLDHGFLGAVPGEPAMGYLRAALAETRPKA